MARMQYMKWVNTGTDEDPGVKGHNKLTDEVVAMRWSDISERNVPSAKRFCLTQLLSTRTSAVDAYEKVAAMHKVIELVSGDRWTKESAGGGPTLSIEVEAVARMFGKSVAVIQKLRPTEQDQDGKGDRVSFEKWVEWVSTDRYQEKLEELENERAASKDDLVADLDAMLDQS